MVEVLDRRGVEMRGEEGRGELREDDLAVVGAPESRENVYGGGADVEEDRVLALQVLHAV